MPRPVTHGARWLAARLDANRLEPRIRRMLAKLQRELHSHTWETLHALVLARLARRELLAQQREAHLLANPDAEGGKWLVAVWAAQRRDVEMLALLERIERDDQRVPTLDEYLRSHGSGPADAQTGAPASAGAAVRADAPTSSHDAVTGSAVQPDAAERRATGHAIDDRGGGDGSS